MAQRNLDDRTHLRAAHERMAAAREAAEHVRRSINVAHSKHLVALKALAGVQDKLDAALRTDNAERLKHLLDPEVVVGPSLPELQQDVATHQQVVNQCEADVNLLATELHRREGIVNIEAANIREAVGHLLMPRASEMLHRMTELYTEAETLRAALMEFPTASFSDPHWNALREYSGDTSLAHRWRDVVRGLNTNADAQKEP